MNHNQNMKKRKPVGWSLLALAALFVAATAAAQEAATAPDPKQAGNDSGPGAASVWRLDSIFGGIEPLDCTRIPISFIYDGKTYNSLPAAWQVVREERRAEVGKNKFIKAVKDPATGLIITVEAKVVPEFAAIEWLAYFENTGKQDTPILQDIQPLAATLPVVDRAELVLHQIKGDSVGPQGYFPFETRLKAGQRNQFQPSGGLPAASTFPFFNVECQEQGVVVAIGWTGQWQASVSRAEKGQATIKAGMEKTRLKLHPGEKIQSPRILLMFWNGDYRASQNRFRQLMIKHYSPKMPDDFPLLPVAAWDWPLRSIPNLATEEKQRVWLERMASCGVETYWMDATWFEGKFPESVGNWFHKPKGFPNGLRPLSDAGRKKGMRFQLWFEPARVGKDTLVMRESPSEWLIKGLGRREGMPYSEKVEADDMFNFGIPAARQWMTDKIGGLIDEYGVDIYREDCCFHPLEYWRKSDTPDRQGMTEILYVQGFYEFWDELRKKRPNLVIDNCAGGGTRINLDTCVRSIPMWRSDDGMVRGLSTQFQTKTMGLSQFIPFHMIGSWGTKAYENRSSATMGIVLQWNFFDDKFSYEEAREAVAEIKANREYWLGDFYPLTKPSLSPKDWNVYQLHRSDLDAGVIYAFRQEESSDDALTVAVAGVAPDRTYQLSLSDEDRKVTTQEVKGEQLKTGFVLSIPRQRASLLVRYEGSRTTTETAK